MEKFERLLRVEVISNRDFLGMSLIASAQVGPFSKLAGVFQFSLSSVSSNNAAYNRWFVLKLIKKTKRSGLQQLYEKELKMKTSSFFEEKQQMKQSSIETNQCRVNSAWY